MNIALNNTAMFKTSCILCSSISVNYFCETCYTDLPWNRNCCQHCALPLPENNELCGQCLQKKSYYDRVISPFIYSDPIDYLITHFKYQEQLAYGKVLSDLLLTKLNPYYQTHAKPEMIIPIPLHRQRLIERGFNQALELAKPIAKTLKIPVDYRCAARIRNTAKQSGLSIKERAANIRKAFAIEKQSINHVAVVDDVITTGHTMEEFCQVLRKAGITKIDVWCVARTGT